MKNLTLKMNIARRMITSGDKPGIIENPPAINRLVTFKDEEGETTYKELAAMELLKLAAHETLPTTKFDVTQTNWSLTEKGIAWVFECDEAYRKYAKAHTAAMRAKKELENLQAPFNKRWKREHPEEETDEDTEDTAEEF